jgi:hypothetical protein
VTRRIRSSGDLRRFPGWVPEDRRVSTIIEEGRFRYTGTMKDLSRDREIQKEYLSA